MGWAYETTMFAFRCNIPSFVGAKPGNKGLENLVTTVDIYGGITHSDLGLRASAFIFKDFGMVEDPRAASKTVQKSL